MVTFTDHRFTLAGYVYNPKVGPAFQVPTVFSGLSVKYGADSCSDHPGPSTLSGRLFLPEMSTAFYPTLNDPLSYSVAGSGGFSDVFQGRIDSLTIEDVEGFRAPARFPNSRNMLTLSGWSFTTGASDVPDVPSTAVLGGAPHRIRATAATLASTQPPNIKITTPRAPVVPGTSYAFSAQFKTQFATPTVQFLWYTTSSSPNPIKTEYATSPFLAGPNDSWAGVCTETREAPAGAKFLAVRVQLVPYSNGEANEVLLDTVTLLTKEELQSRPAGRWVTFQASDITAAAARLMVADTPWPAEQTTFRIQRLNELVPREFIVFGTDPIDYTELAYRDIDNQSAMSVFQRIATSIGAVAVASPQFARLITTGRPPRSPLSLEMLAGTPQVVDDPDLVKIPAGSIRKDAFSTSITGLSNSVQFNYRSWVSGGSEDASAMARNAASIAAFGPMARTIDTDLPAPTGKAWDQAQRIVLAQASPVYRLSDATNVILSELPEDQASWDLFNAVEGFRRLVHIPDAPPLIGPYHRVRSATMNFGKTPTLSLDLEPSNQIASDSVTFYNLSRFPYNNAPFSKFTHLTFRDLDNASPSASA